MKAVIQAGGQGTRLRPYTLVLPKPLMPVGGKPVIELLICWLRRNGIDEACITIGYLGHLIKALLGDGSQWSIGLQYSEEPEPLGTVGPLHLIRDQLTETFLLLNGDLITDLNIREFVDFHRRSGGLISVATARKDVKIDLGVLEDDGARVTAFREKPVQSYRVSMGIYCIEPEILELIPQGIPFGFDDLMYAMLEKDLPVFSYHHKGIWMDIGRPEDFIEAQKVVERNGDEILGI